MRDDTYTPTVAVQVDSGDSPMAEALQNRAQEANQFAQKMSGIVQQQVNQKQASESVKNAQKEGLAWTPKSNLTEAGRAYNQAGRQVALNMGTADLLGGINQAYNQTMNSPAGEGNLQTFQKSAQQYFNTQMQSVAPSLQPELSQSFKSAYLSDSNEIARREAQYTRAKSIASLNDTHTTLSNEAASQGSQAMQSQDPVFQNLMLKASHDNLLKSETALQQAAALNGNYNVAANGIRQGKINYFKSILFGQQKGLMNLIQNTNDPNTQQQYVDKLHSLSTNFMDNPNIAKFLGNVSPNDLVSANEQYRIGRELSRNTNNYMNALQGDKEQNKTDAANALAAATQGKVIDAQTEARLQRDPSLYAQWHPKYVSALSSHSILDNLNSQSRDQQLAWYNKYGTGQNALQVNGLDEASSMKVQKNVAAQIKKTINLENKDPGNWAYNSPQFNQYLNTTHPSWGDQQTEVSHVLANPMENFNSIRTPQAMTYLHNAYNKLTSLQVAKGLPSQSVMSNQQADSIANQLNTQTPTKRLTSLQNARMNYGNDWGSVQKALINTKKIPYNDFIALQLFNSNRAGTAPTDLLNANDAIKENGQKFWEQLGTTQATAIKSVLKDSTFNNALASFQQYPGDNATKAVQGMAQSIANVAAIRMQEKGKQWKDEPDILAQASKDVIGSLYQHNASEGIRVPYHVNVKDSKGNIQPQPIDYDTVKEIMTYMKKNASQLGAIGTDHAYHATWKNNPDGSGLVLINPNGQPYYNKNKKPFGFSFMEAANPGSIPGYEHYRHVDNPLTLFSKD